MRSTRTLAITLACISVLAQRPANLTFKQIDFPVQSSADVVNSTEPTHVSAKGIMVGVYKMNSPRLCPQLVGGPCGPQGFIYESGKYTTINGPLKGRYALPLGVSNQGQILIRQASYFTNGPSFYFIYDLRVQTSTPVSMAGEVSEAGSVGPIHLQAFTGISDGGEVFGVYQTARGPCAVRGTPSTGSLYTLIGCPVLPGKAISIRDADDGGEIIGTAGQNGFLWKAGEMTPLTYPLAVSTTPVAINKTGLIVGTYQAGGPTVSRNQPLRGFVYDGSQFTSFEVPGASITYVGGIGDHGEIVGLYRDRATEAWHGYELSMADLK